MTNIGTAIRAARERKGRTQTELGRLAAVDQSTVSRIEAGLTTPGSDVLLRIARALGMPVSELIDPPRRRLKRRAA